MRIALAALALAAAVLEEGGQGLPVDNVPPEFEAVSVKRNPDGIGSNFLIAPGGRLTATNVSMFDLVRIAYAVQGYQVLDAPAWTRSERYDILATAPGFVNSPGRLPLLLQKLLAERFNLVVRRERREMGIYRMVRARAGGPLGPKLAASTFDCPALASAAAGGAPPQPGPSPLGINYCNMTMQPGRVAMAGLPLNTFARELAGRVSRVVVDQTGLSGTFDLEIQYTPEQAPGAAPAAGADDDMPSLFAALQEQLGLKLEPARGPVDVVVIEKIERPAAD